MSGTEFIKRDGKWYMISCKILDNGQPTNLILVKENLKKMYLDVFNNFFLVVVEFLIEKKRRRTYSKLNWFNFD